jgi:hypothetical protein
MCVYIMPSYVLKCVLFATANFHPSRFKKPGNISHFPQYGNSANSVFFWGGDQYICVDFFREASGIVIILWVRGSLVVKALCYKPESHGLETQCVKCNFSIYLNLPSALGSAVYQAYNRNEYQKQNSNISGE